MANVQDDPDGAKHANADAEVEGGIETGDGHAANRVGVARRELALSAELVRKICLGAEAVEHERVRARRVCNISSTIVALAPSSKHSQILRSDWKTNFLRFKFGEIGDRDC